MPRNRLFFSYFLTVIFTGTSDFARGKIIEIWRPSGQRPQGLGNGASWVVEVEFNCDSLGHPFCMTPEHLNCLSGNAFLLKLYFYA
jgi:hypothetical protein